MVESPNEHYYLYWETFNHLPKILYYMSYTSLNLNFLNVNLTVRILFVSCGLASLSQQLWSCRDIASISWDLHQTSASNITNMAFMYLL